MDISYKFLKLDLYTVFTYLIYLNFLNLYVGTLLSESEILHKQSNHPVHMRDNGQWSPSAFIPFCDFGGDMMVLGIKVDNFSVPVCNSFKARVLNDQLCYEVDVNEIISESFSAKDLKLGLVLLIDENMDRQYDLTKMNTSEDSGIWKWNYIFTNNENS